MKQAFDFSIDFQRLIIKFILVDEDWIVQNREFLNPSYMETVELESLLRICVDFYDKHDIAPDISVLQEIINKSNKGEIRRMLVEELKEIGKLDANNSKLQYTNERLRDFATRQKYRDTIISAAEKLEENQIGDIRGLFDSAAAFGEQSNSAGVFYFNESEIEERSERERTDIGDKIPTLFPTVDKRLRGGVSRKELAIFMMPVDRGKSTALINVGANALMSGKNVLHITNELSAKKTSYRYDSRLSGLSYDEIVANPEKFKKLIDKHHTLCKGDLHIKEYPARSATTNDIKAYMKVLSRRYNFHTDVLIVDYVDELKRPKRDLEAYAIGDVVAGLRAIASELNIGTWTATQTTRQGFSKTKLDLDDVADSWEKAKIADIVIAGCQTQEEFEKNEMRWIIIKNRDNKKYLKPILMETRFDIASYREK